MLTIAIALVFALARINQADDAFVCCMGGWKEIHGTELCSAPCCPGYEEVVERPPLLSPLVYCKKLPATQTFDQEDLSLLLHY